MPVAKSEASGTFRAIAASALQPSGLCWFITTQVQDKVEQSDQGRGFRRSQPPPLQGRSEEGSSPGAQPNNQQVETLLLSPNQSNTKLSAGILSSLLFLPKTLMLQKSVLHSGKMFFKLSSDFVEFAEMTSQETEKT